MISQAKSLKYWISIHALREEIDFKEAHVDYLISEDKDFTDEGATEELRRHLMLFHKSETHV